MRACRAARGSIVLALLIGLASAAPRVADAAESLVGQPAPNLIGRSAFSAGLLKLDKLRRDVTPVLDETGRPVREGGRIKTEITDYALVLNFFATYCVPCIQEIPTFNKVAKSYEGSPVRFLYINVDAEKSSNEVVKFARARGIAVDMMLPSVKNAIDTYRIEALPLLVIVDRAGNVAHVIRGFQDDLAGQIDGLLKPLLAGPG